MVHPVEGAFRHQIVLVYWPLHGCPPSKSMKSAPARPVAPLVHRLIKQLPGLMLLAYGIYVGCGLAAFVLVTPVVRDLPFAWHPIVLPFYDDVITNQAGIWRSVELWAYLVALLALCSRLRPRRFALLILGYGVVGVFGVGQHYLDRILAAEGWLARE